MIANTLVNVKISRVIHSAHPQTVHGLMYAVHLNDQNGLKEPVPVSLALGIYIDVFAEKLLIRMLGNSSVYMLPAATKDQLICINLPLLTLLP